MTHATRSKFNWTTEEAETIGERFVQDHVHLIDAKRKVVLGSYPKCRWYTIMRAFAGHLERSNLLNLVCQTCTGFDSSQIRDCSQRDCLAWSWRPIRGISRRGFNYDKALKQVCQQCPHGGSDERIQACVETGCCFWTNRQPGGQPLCWRTNCEWYQSLPESLKLSSEAD